MGVQGSNLIAGGKALWGEDIFHVTMDMSTVELVKHFGYPVEEHIAQTKDGFILSLQRIPHSKQARAALFRRFNFVRLSM